MYIWQLEASLKSFVILWIMLETFFLFTVCYEWYDFLK